MKWNLHDWIDVCHPEKSWIIGIIGSILWDQQEFLVRYRGLPIQDQEWIPFHSPRVAPLYTHTSCPLVTYEHLSPKELVHVYIFQGMWIEGEILQVTETAAHVRINTPYPGYYEWIPWEAGVLMPYRPLCLKKSETQQTFWPSLQTMSQLPPVKNLRETLAFFLPSVIMEMIFSYLIVVEPAKLANRFYMYNQEGRIFITTRSNTKRPLHNYLSQICI